MKNKDVEVKMSVLKMIYSAMLPIHYRLDSLLEDLIYKRVLLSETDKAVLLEYCSCAGALKVIFEDHFERFPDNAEKIILPYEEYVAIMSLSKTVELATRTSIGSLSILEH